MPPKDEKKGGGRPSDVSARPDMIGRVLSDRYRIDALIATGSFGAVYLGAHLHMRKQVAIKVLKPELAESLGRQRFVREIRIDLPDRNNPMVRRQHPQIGKLIAELMSLLDIGQHHHLDG